MHREQSSVGKVAESAAWLPTTARATSTTGKPLLAMPSAVVIRRFAPTTSAVVLLSRTYGGLADLPGRHARQSGTPP
jgi:hypothetical protein